MGLSATVLKYCTVTDALVWTKRTNSSAGKPVYNKNPTAIKCRWDGHQVQIIARDGRTITSKARIMSPTAIPEEAWIFKGTLADWQAMATYPALPTPLEGGYEVMAVGDTPGFNGEELLHQAWL